MPHRHVAAAVLACASLIASLAVTCLAEEKTPREQPEFRNPAAAFAAWSAAEKTAEKQFAVSYLQEIIQADPPDTNIVFDAFTQLARIYAQENKTNEVVEIRRRQLALAGDDLANAYPAAIALSDALAAVGDDVEAAGVLTEMLEKHPSPAHFRAAWSKLTIIYRRQREDEPVIQICAKLLANETDPDVIFTLVTSLSAAYSSMQDYANAVTALDNFLERNREQASPANIVSSAKSLVNIQIRYMENPDEAIRVIDRELQFLPDDAAVQKADLLAAKAAIVHKDKDDPSSAAELYRTALSTADDLPIALATTVYLDLAGIYRETGETEKATGILLEGLTLYGTPLSVRVVQQLIDITDDETVLMNAVWLLHEKIIAELGGRMVTTSYQMDIVRLLVRAGKPLEALQEARVLLYTCPDASLPAAVEMVAWVLKANDGNLARANLFLKHQKYGPAGEDGKLGTPDDLPDVLMQTPVITNERRLNMYNDYVKTLPTDWAGYKKRGDVILYTDRPLDAFNAYRRAFELCPLAEKDLQSVTDGMAACIVRTTRDVKLAERMVEYIMFGPAGRDHRLGTDDDIADPMPDIIASIQSTVKPSAPVIPSRETGSVPTQEEQESQDR